MVTKHSFVRLALVGAFAVALAACASGGGSSGGSSAKWKSGELATAIANPGRPQADKDRDADRKPAELLTFFGVERGMTALDVIASAGYLTETISVAVGPTGKVYMQNPASMFRNPTSQGVKNVEARVAAGRLPNVVRVDADLPSSTVPAGSVDFAITAMNLHDVYNRSAADAETFAKNVYDTLKPGGVFGVIDHIGSAGADNAKLHRMQKQQAIDVLTKVGFKLEAESAVLAHAADDHTKGPFDPSLRGKTDQFVLKMRKPK